MRFTVGVSRASCACLVMIAACARAPAPAASAQAVQGRSSLASSASPNANAAPGTATTTPAPAGDAALAWAQLNAATFARARAENRIVLIDGSAEWCHWCHVMDATTYRDPAVRKLLAERFLPVKVDIDSRPDFEERYSDWGWPATVIMTADAEEIGKYKGYMPPARLLEVLNAAAAAPRPMLGAAPAKATAMQGGPLTAGQVADAAAMTQHVLDSDWDPKHGSWGEPQKVPLYWDNAWALEQARATTTATGSDVARKRALFTLDQQRKIIDPVWGGICQYSTDGDWLHPHFEKLAPYQAGAIDNYATAFALTGDAQWLQTAQLVRGFVDHFLTSPEGGFYDAMDADLNAHDPSKTFVSGHDYYAKDDAGRRALGIPRVDTHEYGADNGLLIAAYVTLGQAGHDATAVATAERAAARILATHATDASLGGIGHSGQSGQSDPDDTRALYLADNASFGFALTRLYEATGKAAYLDGAKRIGDFLMRQLADPSGGFFASTPDPTAVGVLSARRRPFEDNVMAIRFLARLARITPTDAYRAAIQRTLAAVTTREAIDERGRMVGDLMLAIEESRDVR